MEGGGDTARTIDPFRRGMSAFLKSVKAEVRARHIRWRVIPCGGRREAYDAFIDALDKEPEVFNVLLVDSEDPIAITVAPWKHVKQRKGDKWDQPKGADDARLQMMAACMEAWFLADPAALEKHFGDDFDSGTLPSPDDAESRTKANVSDALKKAAKKTTAKEYRKIRDGAKLLEKIDSSVVRRRCKWCDRLFDTLAEAIGTPL